MGCHWWNRWWHRRLRRMDMSFILDAIHVAAKGDLTKVTKMWNYHKTLPGQEHWRCECSRSPE